MLEKLKKLRGMNPQTHPGLFRVVALVLGGSIGLFLISYATGFPAAIWGY